MFNFKKLVYAVKKMTEIKSQRHYFDFSAKLFKVKNNFANFRFRKIYPHYNVLIGSY